MNGDSKHANMRLSYKDKKQVIGPTKMIASQNVQEKTVNIHDWGFSNDKWNLA